MIYSLSRIILSSFPFLLITGPFLTDFFLVIFGIISIYLFYKLNKLENFRIIFLSYIFWLLYLVIRSSISSDPLLSLESSLFYFRFGLLVIGVYLLLENNFKKTMNSFLITLNFIFLILCLDVIREVIFGINIFYYFGYMDFFKFSESQTSGLFGDRRVLGGFVSRFLPIIYLSIIYFKRIKYNKMYHLSIFVFFASIYSIIVSGERSAIVNTLFILTFILIFSNIKLIYKLSVTVLSILGVYIFFQSNTLIKYRIFDLTQYQINTNFNNILEISRSHEYIYKAAFEIFQNNLFFGIGPKLFRVHCKYTNFPNGCSTHPHHSFLQLLSEVGILGATPVMFLIVYVIYKLIGEFIYINFFKKNKLSKFELIFLLCIFINLNPFTPSGNFFNNWLSLIYYLPIGFILYFSKKRYKFYNFFSADKR